MRRSSRSGKNVLETLDLRETFWQNPRGLQTAKPEEIEVNSSPKNRDMGTPWRWEGQREHIILKSSDIINCKRRVTSCDTPLYDRGDQAYLGRLLVQSTSFSEVMWSLRAKSPRRKRLFISRNTIHMKAPNHLFGNDFHIISQPIHGKPFTDIYGKMLGRVQTVDLYDRPRRAAADAKLMAGNETTTWPFTNQAWL